MTAPTIDFKTRIEEMVISSMGSLFPEAELKAMVDQAIEKFFQTTASFSVSTGRTNHWEAPKESALKFNVSPFETMVWTHVHSITSKALDAYFEQEKSALLGKLTESLSDDTEFQGRLSANVVKMATVIQSIQTQAAIDRATGHLQMETMNALRRNGMPHFTY